MVFSTSCSPSFWEERRSFFVMRRHDFHQTEGNGKEPKLRASPFTRYRWYTLALFKTFQGFCQCGRWVFFKWILRGPASSSSEDVTSIMPKTKRQLPRMIELLFVTAALVFVELLLTFLTVVSVSLTSHCQTTSLLLTEKILSDAMGTTGRDQNRVSLKLLNLEMWPQSLKSTQNRMFA